MQERLCQLESDCYKKVRDSLEKELKKRYKGYKNVKKWDLFLTNLTHFWADIEKNLKEHKCLFEYVSRNRYKYIGTGQSYTGFLYHHPKGSSENIVGKIENGVVEWYSEECV